MLSCQELHKKTDIFLFIIKVFSEEMRRIFTWCQSFKFDGETMFIHPNSQCADSIHTSVLQTTFLLLTVNSTVRYLCLVKLFTSHFYS